jgi:hypothetical protein
MNHEKSTWDVENMSAKERRKMINNSEAYTKAKTATLSVDNLSLSEQAISAIIVLATKYAALQKEVAFLTSASVCEIAARNPSVMEYITEMEKRAERAEAQLATAREGFKDVLGMLDDPTGGEHERDMRGASIIARKHLALLDHPAPSPEAVARAEQAIQFVRQMAMLALSGEHDDDEENHLLSHDILKFQRDCDITEARSILALLDRPAPSPEAVARAALEWAAGVCEAARSKRNKQRAEWSGGGDQARRWMAGAIQAEQLAQDMRIAASDDDAIAAIIDKAREGGK